MEKRGGIEKWHYIILFSTVIVLIGLLAVNLFFLIEGRCGNLQGDANGDGAVNNLDVKQLKDFIDGKKLNCKENADFNSDGRVDILDGRALTTYLLSGKDERFSPDGALFGKESDAGTGSDTTDLGKRSEDRPSRGLDGGKDGSDECKTYVGDVNGDGKIDRADYDDMISLLSGSKEVKCPVNADVDYSGRADSKDKNYLREYLFGDDTSGGKKDLCIEGRCLDISCGNNLEGCDKGLVCLSGVACDCQEECEDKLQCNKGVCQKIIRDPGEDSCKDSDGGKISEVKGSVSGFESGVAFSKTDYCKSGSATTLIEYSCNIDASVENEIVCGFEGCVEGVCAGSGQSSCSNNPIYSCDLLSCTAGQACQCDAECDKDKGLKCISNVCSVPPSNSPGGISCTSNSQCLSSLLECIDGKCKTKSLISCDNNPSLCQGDQLDCTAGKCDCYAECLVGYYCYGSAPMNYVCNAELAPIGSYTSSTYNCRSKKVENGRCVEVPLGGICDIDANCVSGTKCYEGKCVDISCGNNPAGCQSILACSADQSCDCNEECTDGLQCLNGKCSSLQNNYGGGTASCANNPVNSCDLLSCTAGQTCQCNSECASGLLCINGKCSYDPGSGASTNIQAAGNQATSCTSSGQCTSGYCWGSAAGVYACQSSCAPIGSYTPDYCCTGLTLAGGQCRSSV